MHQRLIDAAGQLLCRVMSDPLPSGAPWPPGHEYELWWLAVGYTDPRGGWEESHCTQLMQLADDTQCWFRWDDEAASPRRVSLAEWRAHVATVGIGGVDALPDMFGAPDSPIALRL